MSNSTTYDELAQNYALAETERRLPATTTLRGTKPVLLPTMAGVMATVAVLPNGTVPMYAGSDTRPMRSGAGRKSVLPGPAAMLAVNEPSAATVTGTVSPVP